MKGQAAKRAADIVSGACLCGAVRYEVTDLLEQVAHCHCTMCQRAHGAAFVTWRKLPRIGDRS